MEAKQEFEVAPGIGMVLSATMSMSDFDAPLSITPPPAGLGTGVSGMVQVGR